MVLPAPTCYISRWYFATLHECIISKTIFLPLATILIFEIKRQKKKSLQSGFFIQVFFRLCKPKVKFRIHIGMSYCISNRKIFTLFLAEIIVNQFFLNIMHTPSATYGHALELSSSERHVGKAVRTGGADPPPPHILADI